MNIKIEYIDGLGSSPVMVLKNNTQIVLLVNKNISNEEQERYIYLVRKELSQDLD